ncbi:MAG: hypothetical protein IJ157_11605 [Clostridia bacterium]|nr:hypothetical protein [Clostridia bacterium]
MDFSGRIVLSFMEEDNIQRAYFRVRPLLTDEGALSQADIDALPDEGYLRVVPDKNEQHTFKERMREMGELCVIDLYNLPVDAIKIRTNKNYAPQRGENNQFIVYSDAIQAVPQNLFYEVISAENGEKEKISRAATPQCYLRSGGKIFGPVSRATGLEQEGASQLPPDSQGIFAVTLPDGAEKLFYWPRREHPVERAPEAAMEPAPAAAERIAPQKLSGMPLYQTVARRVSAPQRAHNALVDAVGQQLRAGRVEAPGAVIAAGTAMRPVENPMDAFRHSLDTLWAMPDMQRQAAAHFLSLTGVQNILNQQLASSGSDAVSRAMNSQIQDLEAERLALLMQIESAQKNMAALRQEALGQAAAAEKETLEHVRRQIEEARADLEKAEGERARLLEERDALLAEMEKADPDTLHIKAEVGGYADLDTLCDRIQQSMAAKGLRCEKNDAIHLLTLLCVSPDRLELCGPTAADALEAAKALAGALGAAAPVADETVALRFQEGGDSFRMVIGHYDYSVRKGCVKLIAAAPSMAGDDDDIYQLEPWPVVRVEAASGWKFTDAPTCPPVKTEAVRDAVSKDAVTPPDSALGLLEDIGKALAAADAPLSRQVNRRMYAYISRAAAHMNGGMADAIDYAFCAWIIPHMRRRGIKADILHALTQELPRATALFGKDVE